MQLLKCLMYIFYFLVISLLCCLLGVFVTYSYQSQELAEKLFISYVYNFNGIFVAGVGYGLFWFVKEKRKWILNQIYILLEFDDADKAKILSLEKNVSLIKGNIISIPVTLVGGLILWNCGYPLEGFAKYFLAITSISLYYVGGSMLSFFVFSSRIFWYIEENEDRIKFSEKSSPLNLENFSSYFIIISTIGVLALYLAFRGTLTANFTNVPDGSLIRTFLIFPIVLFSAAPLLYSFYPRYVIKRIYDNSVIARIAEMEKSKNHKSEDSQTLKEKLEMEKLLLDIKESLTIERAKLNILNFKDLPSVLLIILMLLQAIIPHDNIVKNFLRSLIN